MRVSLKEYMLSLFICVSALGCSPSVQLPGVHEPLDSPSWKRCAGELEYRESVGMIDDLTLDSKTLLCKGVAAAARGEVSRLIERLLAPAFENAFERLRARREGGFERKISSDPARESGHIHVGESVDGQGPTVHLSLLPGQLGLRGGKVTVPSF